MQQLQACISILDIKSELEQRAFLDLGEVWWWESNRMIPINIFLRGEIEPFRYSIMTMNSKDVRVTIGPCVNLNNLSIKRIKRKSVQLVRKPKRLICSHNKFICTTHAIA